MSVRKVALVCVEITHEKGFFDETWYGLLNTFCSGGIFPVFTRVWNKVKYLKLKSLLNKKSGRSQMSNANMSPEI